VIGVKRLRVLSVVGLSVVLTAAVVLVAELHRSPAPADSGAISGPYASLLASSVDLGPAQTDHVQLTAALRDDSRPDLLMGWAVHQGLSVRWRPGDSWAILEGAPDAVSGAFDVDVHDYRGRRGQVFYASPQQPSVPQSLNVEVAGLGRILGYTPHRESKVWMLPLEVPDQGLSPSALLRTYNAMPLHDKGYTGKGTTVVVYAFDGFDQADLDTFATTFNLPRFTPDVVGGMPPARRGEATMDLEAIHAIAPDAKKVLVNARSTVEGDGSYEKIAKLMEDTERTYPGAVWSFSIGWGCDKLITAADLVPVRAALSAAHRSGTTAYDASGDLAGLDCKGGDEWSAPPSDNDVGLDAVASMPEMTDVGGTTVSTDANGDWLAEQSWFDPPLSQGTGGGVSALFERPDWQQQLTAPKGDGKRLTPDIAAVADPFTGVQIVFNQQIIVGGGTSLAAPVWAGLTALMNQYVVDKGGSLIGDINPLLYTIAEGTPLPAFRDVVLGGNAVANAGPGYDLVTGLGTPNVENLAQNILVTQKVVG
jgi:kumamolisin